MGRSCSALAGTPADLATVRKLSRTPYGQLEFHENRGARCSPRNQSAEARGGSHVTKEYEASDSMYTPAARCLNPAMLMSPISTCLRKAQRARLDTPIHFTAGTYTVSAVTSSAFGTSVSNLTCWRVGFLSALAINVSLY